MLLITLLMMSQIDASPINQFNMYNTHRNHDEFCLFYYADGTNVEYEDTRFANNIRVKKYAHLLIRYCLRMSEHDNTFQHFNFPSTFGQIYTFDELKENNM